MDWRHNWLHEMQSGSFPTRATAACCDLELREINLFVSLVLAGAVSIPSTARLAEFLPKGSAETKSEVAAGE